MLTVDFAGLLLTIGIIGLRYPHYVLGAALIHDLGRLLMALLFQGRIETIIAAGAFGTAAVSGVKAAGGAFLIALGGPLANYLVGANLGGAAWEKTSCLLHPGAALKRPFAVINLRLALLSALVTIWQHI
jgi:hypothetical protein